MEMSQRNSLCIYLKQTKISCLFFFYKNGEQESRTSTARGVDTSGRGQEVGKGHGRVNVVQIVCTHVCKWKNDTCLNCSRNREEEGIKE
jgi:hypothetical protein